jgi:hypothetical protein
MKIKEIIYREDLYPRFEPNQNMIQKYSDSVEQLPPIKVNQNNILIDGFHRWKAFQLAGRTEIPHEVVNTESEKELKQMAYQLNSNHGLQLTSDEKRKYAQEMFGDMTVKALCDVLGVSEKTIQRWTETQAKAVKEDRDRRIVELYLKAWNTQQSIADIFGVYFTTVFKIIEDFKKRHLSDFKVNFQPILYSIWNLPKQDNERKHFGAFPEFFMENLLYYHTEPLDIVFDPFGGGGTTVDICKRMFRRYYVSDRKIIPGRENDIREHDIKNGLPEDLLKPALAFLDPPYWKQAEGMYSQDADDLGNMTLEQFNDSMASLLKLLSDRKVERIAAVIQPTQYKNDWQWTDHIFDFDKMLPKYKIEARYLLPYSTQQYNAQMVDKAKEDKKCLSLHRDLVVWRKL